jgi:hypothetical protein
MYYLHMHTATGRPISSAAADRLARATVTQPNRHRPGAAANAHRRRRERTARDRPNGHDRPRLSLLAPGPDQIAAGTPLTSLFRMFVPPNATTTGAPRDSTDPPPPPPATPTAKTGSALSALPTAASAVARAATSSGLGPGGRWTPQMTSGADAPGSCGDKDTDNRDQGTDNRDKGMDNRDNREKGTDNRDQGTDNRDKGMHCCPFARGPGVARSPALAAGCVRHGRPPPVVR